MPTAADFDDAARRFESASQDVSVLTGASRSYLGPDVIDGGALAELVDATLDMTDYALAALSAELDGLAATCRQRAATCNAYAHDLHVYHSQVERWSDSVDALPAGEVKPTRPTRPIAPSYWDAN